MTDQQDAPTDAAHGANRLPPLRIHHLLLATVVVATVTALYTSLMQSRDSAPVSYFVYVLGLAIPQALAITTLALGIHWQRQGVGPFFDQPGHWLLVVVSLELFFSVVSPMVFAMTSGGIGLAGVSTAWLAVLLFMIVPRLGAAMAFLVAPRFMQASSAWRPFFTTAGAVWLLSGLFYLIAGRILAGLASANPNINILGSAVAILIVYIGLPSLLVLGIRADRRFQADRHWSHWLGVATWLCVTAAQGFLVIQVAVRNS